MSVRQNGVIIAGSGGGSVDVDNSTITTNASDEIQAVATINANTTGGATNPVYDWVGTLAEHQAQNIETLHPDWICYITDDIDGGTSVYTKAETDTLLATKANDADVMHLTGTETAAGDKTFTNNIFAPASALTNSVITTLSLTKADLGGMKLGNGIIINWGICGNNTHVTFAVPFTVNNYAIVVSPQNDSTTNAAIKNNRTLTGFTCVSGTGTNRFIAIGY